MLVHGPFIIRLREQRADGVVDAQGKVMERACTADIHQPRFQRAHAIMRVIGMEQNNGIELKPFR